MEKEALRAIMKAQRKQLTKDEIHEKSAKVYSALFSSEILQNAKTVMVYLASFNEVRTKMIIDTLLQSGIRVCAPVTDTKNLSITPYYLEDTKNLIHGAFKIAEPTRDCEAKPEDIDAVLVPGIAFDKSGNRMGFGAGYYDRFLHSYDGIKIGICYDFQLFDKIPKDSHDITMNYIISEDKIYAF